MEHFYYVYKITCLMDEWNGMFYIGKHFGKVDDNYAGSGRLIREYFAKYGKVKDVTYIKEIIDYGTEDNICDLECEYIRKGLQSDLCLNLQCASSKGTFGQKLSDKTKQKLSESHIGIKHSNETKQKMSKSHKGQNNPMYGRAPWNKGKKITPLSKEHRAKISEALKGQNNPMSRTNIEKRRNDECKSN